MSHDEISSAARGLINRHIRSIDHAEAALHLAEVADRAHAPPDLAALYRWSDGLAEQVLRDLVESGFAIAVDGGYKVADDVIGSDGLAELGTLYHKQPVTLVRAIYSAPLPMKPLIRPASEEAPSSD